MFFFLKKNYNYFQNFTHYLAVNYQGGGQFIVTAQAGMCLT